MAIVCLVYATLCLFTTFCVHQPRCQRPYLVLRSRRWTGDLLFSLQLLGVSIAYMSTVLRGPQIVLCVHGLVYGQENVSSTCYL